MIRWTGWGILAFPILIFSVVLGLCVAAPLGSAVTGSASAEDRPLGIALGGICVCLIIGGLVNYAMGRALNYRYGTWTDRHTFAGWPVQSFGWGMLVVGVLFLPLFTVGSLPGWSVWVLLAAWLAVSAWGLTVLRRWLRRTGLLI